MSEYVVHVCGWNIRSEVKSMVGDWRDEMSVLFVCLHVGK